MKSSGRGAAASVIMLLILAGSAFSSGCASKQASAPLSTSTRPAANTMLKGVSLSPRSNAPADFTGFFGQAAQAGHVVMWSGDWGELGATNGGPTVVAELASKYGYIPLVELQLFTQSTGKLIRPLNDATKQAYADSAAAFAGKYRPKFLGIGIEVNTLYEKSPADFDVFAGFWSDVYDLVKARSPDTAVFPVFQLERMKGLKGGLFGGVNDPSQAEWPLIDRFPKADMIAFTTYPGIIYKAPSEIPADYYSDIGRHTAKPIAFTEIGWHSDASPPGWESSDAEQGDFVSTFFALARETNPELVVWSFLYDQKTAEPFKSMGLRRSDGSAKPAWEVWVNQSER